MNPKNWESLQPEIKPLNYFRNPPQTTPPREKLMTQSMMNIFSTTNVQVLKENKYGDTLVSIIVKYHYLSEVFNFPSCVVEIGYFIYSRPETCLIGNHLIGVLQTETCYYFIFLGWNSTISALLRVDFLKMCGWLVK